jgi:pimeloyl-ACP methyl ester carboxylesterase
MHLALGTLRWGGGDGRLLLLHGISSNAAGWWRLGPDLAADGWSVSAPDLRGHGTSPIADDYTLAAYAQDVIALGDGWDGVVGHSLGGAVAVVAQTVEPRWARGLVLAEPALLIPESTWAQTLGELIEPLQGPATEEEIAAAQPRWHPTDVRIKGEALCQTSASVVRATMGANRPWDLLETAREVSVPMVILGSDPAQGGITPVSLGEWLAAECQCCRFQILGGAGHSAHREADGYDRYLAAIRDALAWIEQATGEER